MLSSYQSVLWKSNDNFIKSNKRDKIIYQIVNNLFCEINNLIANIKYFIKFYIISKVKFFQIILKKINFKII